ncbi:MAG: secondary thiamine-phosphate synthase enzyme YjbQ [Caldisericia bacterium]
MIELQIKTSKREQFVDITSKLENLCVENNWNDGLLTVFVPHTTCGITINENADPDVKDDMIDFLNKLVPNHPEFKHFEGNSDAHIKAGMMGSSVSVIVEDGKLKLGRWQAVYLAEFDGARERNIWIKFLTD